MRATFQIPSTASEWAGQALFAFFPDGLSQKPLTPQADQFSGWLKSAAQVPALKAALKDLGAGHLRLRAEKPRNWIRHFRSKFPIQKIGRFFLIPSWRKAYKLPPEKFPIFLRQGQAFGTGLHASTQLMLRAIEKAGLKGKNVLDVGAGSGVLSFAALALGAKSACCIEIESAACLEMKENRDSNKVAASRMKVVCGAFPKALTAGTFDVVLGNLVTPLLLETMGALKRRLKRGGVLLMSGIHTRAEAAKVKAAAKKAGLKFSGERSKGDWHCLEAHYI